MINSSEVLNNFLQSIKTLYCMTFSLCLQLFGHLTTTKDGGRLNFSSVAADGMVVVYLQGDPLYVKILICWRKLNQWFFNLCISFISCLDNERINMISAPVTVVRLSTGSMEDVTGPLTQTINLHLEETVRLTFISAFRKFGSATAKFFFIWISFTGSYITARDKRHRQKIFKKINKIRLLWGHLNFGYPKSPFSSK